MRLSALLAVPIALVGLAVPAYAEPGLTVTWPTTTQVEVPNTTYTFTVADTVAEPQGVLYAEWQGERTEIPHTGDHAMSFTKGGTGTIKVVRCVPADPEPVCTDTGDVSPEITVYQHLEGIFGIDNTVSYGPGGKAAAVLESSHPNTTVDVSWRMRRSGSSVDVASGTTSLALNDNGYAEFLLPIPATAGTGGYVVSAVLTADIAPFGPHRVEYESSFEVDATAPSLSVAFSSTALYPHRDGYRDSISARFRTNDFQAQGSVRVINAKGVVVRTHRVDSFYNTRMTIDGRSASGRVLPAGSYRLQSTIRDELGNQRVVTSRSFAVSHKRLQKRTWTRTFKAGATLTRNGAFVQACSTLRKPSLRGWAGSLGYYSRAKCNRDNADIVSTTNGIYVPKAFQNRYGTYQVSFYGGGARGTRGAYIVMGYLNNKNDFTHRIQGGAAVRTYKGKVASAGNFVHDKTTKPYVLWTAGLTDGSRYDVKSFTVKLTYTVLQ